MIPREYMRKTMPGTASVLDHPKLQDWPALTDAIETCADADTFNKLSLMQLSLYFGVYVGAIKTLLEENDRLARALADCPTKIAGPDQPQ